MIENWIDAVQDVWAGITYGQQTVRAPYLVKHAEYPSALDPAKLASEPIALSMAGEVQYEYSAGGPNNGHYQGVTEFHVAPNVDRSLIPSLLIWPRLIVVRAAAHATLGGLVTRFMLQARNDQITGPIELQYGDESVHWGFLVYWEVKESVNSAITVAGG